MRDQYEETNEETTMATGRSFAVGLLCGAATRKELKKTAERLSRRAMKLYDNASETVEQLADRGADVLDRTKEAAARIRT
jgi:hypothetical protein